MKNTVYGYARISTRKQSIERQIRNIKGIYPDAIVLKEAYTGTTTDRPEWNKLYKKIKTGDSIVFDSVSRMSRNADEGIELYMDLFNKGVTLVFLKESYIDTSVYRSTIEQTIGSTGNDIADIYIEATNKVIKLLAEKQIRKAFEVLDTYLREHGILLSVSNPIIAIILQKSKKYFLIFCDFFIFEKILSFLLKSA